MDESAQSNQTNQSPTTEQDIAQLRQMLTVVQIAHMLNKHPMTIRAWFKKPDCPLKPKKIYGQWRVLRSDFAQYINDSGAATRE